MSDVPRPGDYERSDADPRLIGALAVGLAVFLIAVPLCLLALYPGATRRGATPADLPAPPPPRLQVDPKRDLGRLEAQEKARLDGFGWADRDARIAHIPIGRAIQLLTERGIAGWPASPPPAGR